MNTFHLSHPSISLSILLLGGAPTLVGQTSSSAIPPMPPAAEEVIKLNAFVVSSGFDDRSAFDLAQGTSVLAGNALRQTASATLGETLAATPGVNTTSFGPGASRPVIRGLGGDRVRVLANGVGALDASNVSPDHNTAVEPLFASQIEVLRGPATLLYGGSAVGGVVNVIGNAIPSAAAPRLVSGAIELRGAGAARERTGVAALTLGGSETVVQLNALHLRSDDVDIPGVARIDAAAPAVQPDGTLPNSDIVTRSGSIGASWIASDGYVGVALSTYSTLYGVPADEPISINMHQRRVDFQTAAKFEGGFFRGLQASFGLGDYEHSEVADRTTISTTFQNLAWEGRLELPHVIAPNLSGTVGVQATRSDFSAVGEEVVTPQSVTSTQGLFALEEWKRTGWTLQVGGRIERQSIRLGDVDPALPAVPGYSARTGETVTGTGLSGSAGVVIYPAPDWSIGASVAYTQRMPTAQERFSNGPHGGTGAWEVGTGSLGKERSVGLDISVRRRTGFVTGSVGIFVNRFRDYIFEQELPAGTIPASDNPDGLTEYQFVAKDAEFRGAEAELTFHLYEKGTRQVHLELTSDYVHAQQTTDDEPLPRIPPLRFGARIHVEDGPWLLGVETKFVARQDRIATTETETSGYSLLNANVAYTMSAGRVNWDLFFRATNLTNREARIHASFLKEFAPLPGRGVAAGARLAF